MKHNYRGDAGFIEAGATLIISMVIGIVLFLGVKNVVFGPEGANLSLQLHNELTTQVVNAPFQNGYDSDSMIKIYLDQDNITVARTRQKQITYKLKPADTDRKTVYWKSSNNNICTVDSNGVVTGVAAGDAVVYATTESGVQASCKVHVIDLFKISVEGAPLIAGTAPVQYVAQGETCSVTIQTIPYYKFLYWSYKNGAQISTDTTYSFVPEGDTVLVAHCKNTLPIYTDLFTLSSVSNSTMFYSVENKIHGTNTTLGTLTKISDHYFKYTATKSGPMMAVYDTYQGVDYFVTNLAIWGSDVCTIYHINVGQYVDVLAPVGTGRPKYGTAGIVSLPVSSGTNLWRFTGVAPGGAGIYPGTGGSRICIIDVH